MSPAFEGYLARLYTDDGERALFLEDPPGRALAAGLSPAESDALAAIDRDGLLLAAASFQKKRAHRHGGQDGDGPLRSSARRTARASVSGLKGFWMKSLPGSRMPRSSK